MMKGFFGPTQLFPQIHKLSKNATKLLTINNKIPVFNLLTEILIPQIQHITEVVIGDHNPLFPGCDVHNEDVVVTVPAGLVGPPAGAVEQYSRLFQVVQLHHLLDSPFSHEFGLP